MMINHWGWYGWTVECSQQSFLPSLIRWTIHLWNFRKIPFVLSSIFIQNIIVRLNSLNNWWKRWNISRFFSTFQIINFPYKSTWPWSFSFVCFRRMFHPLWHCHFNTLFLLNIKLQKIHCDFGANFLVLLSTIRLGSWNRILKKEDKKSFHSSTRLSEIRNHHKTSVWFRWTTSLFFSQNGKFPSYLDETLLKTEDFYPK
jgi:hypothetical protein